MGVSTVQVARTRMQETLGRLMNRFGFPGIIRDCVIEDELTHQKIEVRRGVLFTKITVNGRDHFFDRITGKFGGSGSGCD
jgi:hypothetical protein